MRRGTTGPLTAAAAMVIAFATPASAQGFLCEHAPAIVSLSDTVLSKRTELGRFQKRNAPAAEAAYLKIVYAPLNDGDTEALLSALMADDARGVDELAFSWSFGQYGGDVTERMLGPEAVDTLITRGSTSAMRAMIREGYEDDLLAAFARLDEAAAVTVPVSLSIATLDYSDEWKAAMARKALDAGLPYTAAALVASQKKGVKAWAQFIASLGDPQLATSLTQRWSWVPAMMGLPELPRTPDQTPRSDPALSARVHDAAIAAMETPQIDFVMTLLNQSGNVDEIHPAAVALHEALARGEIDRDGYYGPAWLLLYRTLLSTWDNDDALRGALRSFNVPTPRGGWAPLDILDTLLAIEALAPYVAGDVADPPDAPPELSPDSSIEWSRWVEIADKVKADPLDPSLLEETTLPVAADLLLAAGDSDAAAALVASAPATFGVTNIAIDLAIHLDRLCASALYHPSEAIQLVERPIYKFDG